MKLKYQIPSDKEKEEVWIAYKAGHPTRVPLRWNINPRIIILNPVLNPWKYTFKDYFNNPEVMIKVQAIFFEYAAQELSKTCDFQSKLPDEWSFYLDCQNIYDGAYFGAPIEYAPNNCPSNVAVYKEEDVAEFLKKDFSKPFENPWLKERLAFHKELTKVAKDFVYAGRKGKVRPFVLGFDGPLTVGAILFGEDIFTLLAASPEKADKLMRKLCEDALQRNKALTEYFENKWEKAERGSLADDSIQLISTEMYEDQVLPIHEFWFSITSKTTPASKNRGMHLCGNVQRHLPLISKKLGVVSFDTGFPIDHGALRKQLGPDIEISGGPEISLLQTGTPEACFNRAKEILESGIKEGGKFILQEGNNLPPCTPLENLAAVYEACLIYGRYN